MSSGWIDTHTKVRSIKPVSVILESCLTVLYWLTSALALLVKGHGITPVSLMSLLTWFLESSY